jgi:hypothetical protein
MESCKHQCTDSTVPKHLKIKLQMMCSMKQHTDFNKKFFAVLCLLGNLPAPELLALTFWKLQAVPLNSMHMKTEWLVSSEKPALKAQTPGDYPKDTTRHSTHGESLKSRSSLLAEVSVSWYIHKCNRENYTLPCAKFCKTHTCSPVVSTGILKQISPKLKDKCGK